MRTGVNTLLLDAVCSRKTKEKIAQRDKNPTVSGNPYMDLIKEEDEQEVRRTIKECNYPINKEFVKNIRHEEI